MTKKEIMNCTKISSVLKLKKINVTKELKKYKKSNFLQHPFFWKFLKKF